MSHGGNPYSSPVHHCEQKCVAVLVILMCGGFDQKSVLMLAFCDPATCCRFRPNECDCFGIE